MALIEMSSVEESILALIVCGIVMTCVISFLLFQAAHNYPISSSSHLRVSFTKSTI